MTDPSGKQAAAEPLGPEAASRIVASLHGPDPHEEPVPEAGDLPAIDGYRTIHFLGAGGGGSVFLAYRDGSDRPLALKLLNRSFSAEGPGSRRAWRELELLTQLRLPAIPRIIDYGQHQGRLFIATEFIDGLPLVEHCKQHNLDRRQRSALLARIADAVHSLHERGVMHRDLKPGNILITAAGDPVIIDLGIAALLTDDVMHTLTDDGIPIGSPAFMAPEQARGERSQMSTRTDVYGVGATACYILTGKTPHDTDTALHSAIQRIANEEPRHPQALDATLPRPLAAVLAKAISRRPEDRYESAAAFAADLRRWLAGEPVMAVSPGVWVRTMRWAARRPALMTATVCLTIGAGMLAAATGAVWWTNNLPQRIDREHDQSYAYLRAANGRVIAKWGNGERGSVAAAQLVERPREFGGGKVVMVIAGGPPEDGGTHNQLAMYPLNRLAEPAWTTPALAPDITMPPNDWWQNEFQALQVTIADVFPQSPGKELILVHGQGRSPHAIRIYDFNGRVLYEAWHLGLVESLQWLESSGLLIASAHRHGRSAADWETEGYVLGPNQWPMVLLALRPEYGKFYNDGWINGIDDWPRSAADLRWYRYLMPRDHQPTYLYVRPSPSQLHPDAVEIELGYGAHSDRTSIRRLLNPQGQFIPGTEIIGDPYRRKLLEKHPTEVYTPEDAADVCGMDVPRAEEAWGPEGDEGVHAPVGAAGTR